MQIRKILLISPPYTLFKNDVRRCVPPIGLMYIASVLENNDFEVAIIDSATQGYYNTKEKGRYITYGLSPEDLTQRIEEFNPDVIGISSIFSTQSKNAFDVFRLVKKNFPKVITLSGGSHPTYSLEESLANSDIDFIILNEGEYSTLNLLNALKKSIDLNNTDLFKQIDGIAFRQNGKDFIQPKSNYIDNLDTLPLPARHLLDMEQYFQINLPQSPYPKGKRVAQLVTSRGCIARCVFCTTVNFWGNRYRMRSAENVIEELKVLKKKYRVDEIQITDDNFTLKKDRALKVIDAMGELGFHWCMPQGVFVSSLDKEMLSRMKESGCYQLTFAIESGNQEVLNKLVKKPLKLEIVKPLADFAQSLGIKVHAFFVCGFPGETLDQMKETFDFAKYVNFDSASFFLATPLVGSELMRVCQEKNYLRTDLITNDQLYKIGNINTSDFTAKEAEDLVAKFNLEFNKKDTREKHFEAHKY